MKRPRIRISVEMVKVEIPWKKFFRVSRKEVVALLDSYQELMLSVYDEWGSISDEDINHMNRMRRLLGMKKTSIEKLDADRWSK